MNDNGMQPRQPAHQADEMERHPVALQVVDHPAASRGPLHPAQERHDHLVGHMMREQAADDEVDGGGRDEIEDVHHLIFDIEIVSCRRLRDADRLAIEIEPDQLDLPAAPGGQLRIARSRSP